MSKYVRKSNRELKFTEELLNEARRRKENGESQRSIADSLGVNECSLRKRLWKVNSFNWLFSEILKMIFFRETCHFHWEDLNLYLPRTKKEN